MMHVSFFHQSTKNRLMKEYLIYFHFRLMHHRNVTRLANQASRWDWHLPENGRNCSGWSSFQFCADSFPICLFTTLIVLPICSEAICRSSIVGHIWKFPKFLYTPPLDLWKPPILPPDLQFSLDWQDLKGSDRLLHGIWENDFNLDVSLKWVMLHQAKLKFPGKLAISNSKNANLQIDVFRCFLAFFYVILCERSLSRLF